MIEVPLDWDPPHAIRSSDHCILQWVGQSTIALNAWKMPPLRNKSNLLDHIPSFLPP